MTAPFEEQDSAEAANPVEEPSDGAFEPTPEEDATIIVGDLPAQGVLARVRAAAVAWGLIAIGGLAFGSGRILRGGSCRQWGGSIYFYISGRWDGAFSTGRIVFKTAHLACGNRI